MSMTPETRWLLTVLQAEPLASPADPRLAVEAVQRQRLSAYVRYRWRLENGCDPPWDPDGSLQRSELERHARRAALDDTLANAVRVADEAGVRYLVIKGQAFARFYPDPWLRAQCDLDLLVDPAHFRGLADALSGDGFAVVGYDPDNPTELVLRNLSNGAQLELHDGFSFDPRVNFEELWSSRDELELCGRNVPVLGDLDTLILSVLHVAAGHLCRNSLPWLLDTRLLLERGEERYPNDLVERFHARVREAGWRHDARRHLELVSSILRPESAEQGGGAALIDRWAAECLIDRPDTEDPRGLAGVWLWDRFRERDTPRLRARRVGKLFWPTAAECRRRFPDKSPLRRRLAHYGEVARFFGSFGRREGGHRIKTGVGWGAATGTLVAIASLWPATLGWLVLPAFVPVFLFFLERRRGGFERLGLSAGVVLPWATASLGGFFPVLVWSLGIHPLIAAVLMAVMGSIGICWLYLAVAPCEWLRNRSWVPALAIPLLLGAWFGLTEWVRGLVTAPWSELGYPLIGFPLLAFPARWVTLNGLSAGAIAVSGYAALALHGSDRRRQRAAAMAILIALLGVWMAGRSMAGAVAPAGPRPALNVLVIQPGFPTADKYDVVKAAEQVRALIELTATELSRYPSSDLVIWPESAINFNYTEPLDPELEALLEELRDALDPYPGVHVLTGMVRRPDGEHRFNAALLFNSRLELVGQYDRRTLIPIGEYTPFYLPRMFGRPGIRSSPFAAGADEQGVLRIGDHTLGVLICHEALFAGYAREYEALGAGLVINIGNDEIFRSARNPGLAMHINHTRFRAIESGIPVIRVFNSGPSGLLLPDGSYEDLMPFEVGAARTGFLSLR